MSGIGTVGRDSNATVLRRSDQHSALIKRTCYVWKHKYDSMLYSIYND